MSQDGDLRRKARDVATAVAFDLWRRMSTDFPPGRIYLSLSDPIPSTALLFAELAAYDREWEPRLHSVLTSAASQLRSAPGAGLFAGPMSLGFALHMASIVTGGYRSAISRLDAEMSGRVLDRLDRGEIARRLTTGRLDLPDYDVVSGLTGILRYFLLDPIRHADAIARLSAALVDIVCAGRPDRPGWTAVNPPVVGTDPTKFPRGHINVGMAHGAAGILAGLSLAAEKGVEVPGHEKAISTLADWLVAAKTDDVRGTAWPAYFAVHQKTGKAATHVAGWCYGTPGIARALQLANLTIGGAARSSSADDAMRAIIARRNPARSPFEYGLCHGLAGTLHAVWRYAADSPGLLPHGRLNAISSEIIARFDGNPEAGYRAWSRPDETTRTDDYGFIEGAVGVCLSLHRFGSGKPPATPWDAALLLA
ncbi:lanthionine synthetase C family protein [Asanoa siamensis]|uniref:Lanthionine synthetase-like protein n=1 Tax=Asanoa siamensis TaxID=926357 RepID=A0ABQ4CQK6_9ACTN|nr:lanthionine synthetase C family protein [Asanoa siamensis]GIF73578.1 hypothetical protein Asi02nite_30960 [Asanoa siamensis]